MSRSLSTLSLRLFTTLALLTACGEATPDPAVAPAPVAPAPAPLEVAADREGVVYRYLDAERHEVATATSLAEIPAAARGQVVVFDTLAPPPPGWDLVADLSRGLPATATPRQDFVFPSARPGAGGGPAVARDAKAGHEVVMFSTAGCGYCRKARAFFKSHRVPFTDLDLEDDPRAPERLASLGRKAGVPSSQLQGVPIIFVDGQVVLGWDEGRLRRLLHI